MEKVSLIIPVYNCEKYLAQAIESCIDQTIPANEIIIIDDGSTDKSLKIAFSYAVKNRDIRLIKNWENKGIGFTRARGVEEAKGDYVGFCSADDVLNPNFVESMLSYAKSYPNCIFYSDFEMIDEDGNKTGESRSPEFNDYNQFVQAVIGSAKKNRMFTCYNIFAPTKLLKENNFDPEKRFGEDLLHCLYCILVKKIRFVHVSFLLFKYRVHRKMVTTQKWNEIAANNLKTFEKINKLLGGKIL